MGARGMRQRRHLRPSGAGEEEGDMAEHDAAGRGERSSALWGSTRRDGDSKPSALWGNGGPGGATVLTALPPPTLPLAAVTGETASAAGSGSSAIVPDALLADAQSHPDQTFRVIVQGTAGQNADGIAYLVAQLAAKSDSSRAAAAAKQAQDEAPRLAANASKAAADAASAKLDAAAKRAKANASARS